jgi:ParB family chromosome partitioning protein
MKQTPRFAWVNIADIQYSGHQPRVFFDEQKLQELAASIAHFGILQPLLLRSDLSLVAGERRLRAAQFVGMQELPCMILPVSEEEHALLALLENIQREQIEPLEEAMAFFKIKQEFGWTQEHLSKLLGKSRAYIANSLRLLKCAEVVQKALQEKQISYGHARVLIVLSQEKQQFYVDYIQKHQCSVRQLEKMVALDKQNSTQQTISSPLYLCEYAQFMRELTEKLGSEVNMDLTKSGGGWLKFKFYDQDTLAGLLERLGLSYDEESFE